MSWRDAHRRRVMALEAEAAAVMLDALDGILGRIAASLGDATTITAASEAEASASLDDLNAVLADWRAAVDEIVLPYFGGIFEAGGVAATEQLAGIGVIVPAPDREFTDMAAAQYLAQSRDRFMGLGDEAWNAARDELLTGFREGEGIGALTRRVRNATDLTRSRAEALARTEVIAASNMGADARVRMLGDDAPPFKQWLSTMDGRTRPTHRHADGQVRPLRVPFEVGASRLQVPGDPTGPAAEVINCRCTVLYLDDDTPLDLDGRQTGGPPREQGIVDLVAEPDLAPAGPGPAIPAGGRAVGDALASDGMLPTWATGPRDHVAGVIDSLHGDGVLSDLPIRSIPDGDSAGGHFMPGQGSGLEIALNRAWTNDEGLAEFGLAHEVGHWLDFEALGPQSRAVDEAVDLAWGTVVPDRPLNAVMRAIRGSAAAQDVKAGIARYAALADTDTANRAQWMGYARYADYLNDPRELWARAYSQWVATRSQDPVLLAGLRRFTASQLPSMPAQWTDDDFAPIGDAIDQLMAAYGWRNL